MIKFSIGLMAAMAIVFSMSCSKGDPSTRSRSQDYAFSPNITYNGASPLYGATLELSGFSGGVVSQAKVTLSGTVANKKYPIHIHQHDFSTGTYGTEIAYNLGDHVAQDTLLTVFKEIPANINFLLDQFKGHLVVHDPDRFSNADTLLLIIGPVGNH